MKIFTPPALLQAGLIGGTCSRHAGSLKEAADQARVLTPLGIPPQRMLHLHQIHSDVLLSFSSADQCSSFSNQPCTDADGWVFAPAPTGWGATIITADCVPFFVWAQDGSAWALSHCGWRGVVQQLPLKTIQALQACTRQPLYCWAGPHIQTCCFEVQQDTACQFPPQTIIQRKEKLFVDLNAAIRLQLEQAAMEPERCFFSYDCTCCDKENFFSWRRDHQRNMLLSFIYKP